MYVCVCLCVLKTTTRLTTQISDMHTFHQAEVLCVCVSVCVLKMTTRLATKISGICCLLGCGFVRVYVCVCVCVC